MKKIVSICFSSIIFLFLFIFILLPKEKYSENENRYLEKIEKFNFENIKTGKFQSSLNDYISDHFPFRTLLLGNKNKIMHLLGMYRINNVYYSKNNKLLEEYSTPKNSDRIIRVVNKFSKKHSNINIQFMLVPTSISIYEEDVSKYNLNASEFDAIDYYKNNLGVKFIDTRNILLENKESYIFYNSDHHWTTLGAYYAYLNYCSVNNLEVKKYDFDKVSNDFRGTLYSKILDNSTEKDYIIRVHDDNKYSVISDGKKDSLYNTNYLSKKDKYSFFLGGNKGITSINNLNNKSDNNILIIKDSYANSFVPFIINNYKNVYVIDPRYYKESIDKFIIDNDIENILFLYNILTIDDDLGIVSINR